MIVRADISKIERIISRLAANKNQTVNDFIIKFCICNIRKLFNQQSLSLKYDVWHNRMYYTYIALISNNSVYGQLAIILVPVRALTFILVLFSL